PRLIALHLDRLRRRHVITFECDRDFLERFAGHIAVKEQSSALVVAGVLAEKDALPGGEGVLVLVGDKSRQRQAAHGSFHAVLHVFLVWGRRLTREDRRREEESAESGKRLGHGGSPE